MAFDCAAEVSKHLSAALGMGVHTDIVPEHPVYPYVVVRLRTVTPAAPPSTAWDEYSLDVDVCGDVGDIPGCNEMSVTVRSALWEFTGSRDGGAVAATDVLGTSFALDDSVSPPRPRWVTSALVSARSE